MSSNAMMGILTFTMKYFFDVEREITQQLITTAAVRLHDCKELITTLVSFHK